MGGGTYSFAAQSTWHLHKQGLSNAPFCHQHQVLVFSWYTSMYDWYRYQLKSITLCCIVNPRAEKWTDRAELTNGTGCSIRPFQYEKHVAPSLMEWKWNISHDQTRPTRFSSDSPTLARALWWSRSIPHAKHKQHRPAFEGWRMIMLRMKRNSEDVLFRPKIQWFMLEMRRVGKGIHFE